MKVTIKQIDGTATTEIDIDELVLKRMEFLIQSVLDGEEESVKLYYVRPNHVNEFLDKIGVEHSNFDSNGYQWDYWMDVKHEDKMYMLSGDGWYQNYATFEIKK